MDVPGRDPVVLLLAWWVSLALSRSLNLRHSPCGFLYNLLYLSANDTITSPVLFFAVMAVDCGDEIPSKSKPQPAGITSCTNSANLLSFRCFVFGFQFWSLNCKFFSSLPRISQIFYKFVDLQDVFLQFFQFLYPNFFFNFSPNRDVPYIFGES